MYKIALITLISLPIFAGFFPTTVQTLVKSADHKSIQLQKALPLHGMSGVVIHTYAKGLDAITSHIIQDNNNTAKLISTDIIHHDALPTISTPVKPGDKIIGGYLYNNVLLLAPDATTYARITKKYDKKWIHPDLFALFLSSEGETKPSKQNLKTFAHKYQIGLIALVNQESIMLMDALSGEVLARQSIDNLPSKGLFPFYMRLDKPRGGWFSSDGEEDYYSMIGAL